MVVEVVVGMLPSSIQIIQQDGDRGDGGSALASTITGSSVFKVGMVVVVVLMVVVITTQKVVAVMWFFRRYNCISCLGDFPATANTGSGGGGATWRDQNNWKLDQVW